MACSTEALEDAVERFQSHRENDGGTDRDTDRETAFQTIFTCYFPIVRRFFAKKGVPNDDCYDLAQKTLLKVFENLDGFRRESALKTWISTIAANSFHRWLRSKQKSKHEVSLDADTSETSPVIEPEDAGPSPEAATVDSERRQRLRRSLGELSSRQRLSFILYTYHDLSYKEIASAMQIEVGTVGALLNQARNKLREAFGDEV